MFSFILILKKWGGAKKYFEIEGIDWGCRAEIER